ncbi:hypothetical protein JXR01_00810 [Candidatus Kaiserbacteria bacterium]|nr:MAG: hypothetical protein JXR01_00810 [Candidatus Kaiserbacteria bacterium]
MEVGPWKSESVESPELFRGTLGFDFVFTREDGKLKCYCIEFNGSNSGVQGVRRLPADALDATHKILASVRSSASEKTREAVRKYNDFIRRNPDQSFSVVVAGHLRAQLDDAPLHTHEYSNPEFIQDITLNKRRQEEYIPRANRPNSWKPGDSTKSKSGFWIYKEGGSSRGQGIYILSDTELADMLKEAPKIDESTLGNDVIQELLPVTGAENATEAHKNRAASMRLLMDFRYLEGGTIQSDFSTSYQRIAPHDKNSTQTPGGEDFQKEDTLVVNYSTGALSAAASPMEIKLAKEVAEKVIHNLANTYIKKMINEEKVHRLMLEVPTGRSREVSAVNKEVNDALITLYTRFEDTYGRDYLPFHNSYHTARVIARVDKIWRSIDEGEHDLKEYLLLRLCAAFHDSVQKWKSFEIEEDFNGQKFTKIVRKRFTGQNEKESAGELVACMRQINQEVNYDFFSREDERVAQEAIQATIPAFDIARGTVGQPKLEKHSSRVTRLLALADLGAAGLESEKFVYEGNRIFQEENIDIYEALQSPEKIDDAHKEYFRHRMFEWSKSQPRFAKGRQRLLEKELVRLPQREKKEIRYLFCGFEESIAYAKEAVERRRTMSFEELAKDMGYEF